MKKYFLQIMSVGFGASLVLLGAGCQSKTSSVSYPNQLPSTPPAQTAPVTKSPGTTVMPKTGTKTVAPKPKTNTAVVTIINGAFSPQVIAANDGDTILWVNKDSMSHTTASDGALIWDSGNIAPGASYKRVFHAGTYTYHCGIHRGMTGTVVIR